MLALAEDILGTPTVGKWPGKPAARGTRCCVRGTFLRRLVCGAASRLREDWKASNAGVRRLHATVSGWTRSVLRFPDAQFIHIVRDGRDQAIDISDSVLWPYSVYSGANLWQRYVTAVRDSAARLPADAFIEIRYEDLCAAPEATIRGLCDFLGEQFDPRMLAPHETRSALAWSAHPLHAKTAQPISTRYCGMFKTRLSGARRRGDRGIDRRHAAAFWLCAVRRAATHLARACGKNAGERHGDQSGERCLSALA